MFVEHDFETVVIWSLLGSSIVQTIIHLITVLVTFRQKSETTAGPAMKWRELTLCFKAGMRSVIDYFLLLLVVFEGAHLPRSEYRMAVYAVTSVATYFAIVAGVYYIFRLWQERWGVAESERTNVRQDARDVEQNARQAEMNQQRALLDDRGD